MGDAINNAIETGEEMLSEAWEFTIAAGIVPVVLVLLAIVLFSRPLRFVLKLVINTILGFVALFLINRFGAEIGVTIGMNWTNALVVGVLGVPGVALLFVLKWLMLV